MSEWEKCGKHNCGELAVARGYKGSLRVYACKRHMAELEDIFGNQKEVTMKLTEGMIVKFKKVNNARGYPLTGQIVDADNQHAIVKAWGLYGPGTDTEINDVPVEDLERIDFTLENEQC